MAESPASTDVRDDHDGSRFVLDEDGSTAELVYRTEPGRLIQTTPVRSSSERRGPRSLTWAFSGTVIH